MASRFNLHTKTPKVATLFDYMAPGMTNLKMGAPGETMLKKCAEAMKKAAVHRMVCTGDGGFSDPQSKDQVTPAGLSDPPRNFSVHASTTIVVL